MAEYSMPGPLDVRATNHELLDQFGEAECHVEEAFVMKAKTAWLKRREELRELILDRMVDPYRPKKKKS